MNGGCSEKTLGEVHPLALIHPARGGVMCRYVSNVVTPTPLLIRCGIREAFKVSYLAPAWVSV